MMAGRFRRIEHVDGDLYVLAQVSCERDVPRRGATGGEHQTNPPGQG